LDRVYSSTIKFAIEALALVQKASQRQEPVDEEKFEQSVQKARERLYLTLGTDIRGRTCADTAYTLALSGVTDKGLYNALSKITMLELERVASRPTRRGKDILQIVEKLAASGAQGGDTDRAYRIAAESLTRKGPRVAAIQELAVNRFSLLSERPLLWLWRFSSGLPKPRFIENTLQLAAKTDADAWIQGFKDSSKPLVVDLGCGFGASLLGLASLSENPGSPSALHAMTNWSDCNYVGVDLSHLMIRFAKGIAARWGVSERLQYTVCPTESLLNQVHTNYPGRVALILVQYPSPYRMYDDEGGDQGNSQLPSNVESGFMISPFVMEQIARILKDSPDARLMCQSNCEDVAVRLRDMALQAGLRCIKARSPVESISTSTTLAKRTEKWIRQGGERPIGIEWSAVSLLPHGCSSETEVACCLKATPVHRCLWEYQTVETSS
jgi:SAM-dependent methyltransferase